LIDAQKLIAALLDAGANRHEIAKALTVNDRSAQDARLSENSIAADESDGALPPGVRPMKRIHGPYEKRKKFRLVIIDCATGAQTYESFETKDLAETRLRELRREANREAIEEKGIKVSVAIDNYAQHLKEAGLRPRSIETTAQRMKALFKPALATSLGGLTEKQATRIYGQFCERKTQLGKVPSGDSKLNTLAAGKTFLTWCAAKGHTKRNVLADVKGIGRKSRGKPQLTEDEAKRWLETAIPMMDDEWVIAAVTCLLLGVRSSEIVNRVMRDLDRGGSVLRIPEAKTRAGIRSQAVPDVLKPHLLRLAKGKQSDQHLFTYQGKQGTDRTARACRSLCQLAGVPRVTPHGLRGTHSSISQEAGVTAAVVASALGHESTATTLRHYTTPDAAIAGTQRAFQGLMRETLEKFPAVSRPTDPTHPTS
jgi:integrase/recombinase XerC